MSARIDRFGAWNASGQVQSLNTAEVVGIPPWPGKLGVSTYIVDGAGKPTWVKPGAYTHVTQLGITSGSTAHAWSFMQPLNWSYTSVASAKNVATMALVDDPGIYSTNYRYPCPITTGTAVVADNALAASDYVAFQLTDGTWVFDTISSGTYAAIVLTTTLPNVTGGGVSKGQAVFFFGVVTDKNPATGAVPATVNPIVSAYTSFNDAGGDGIFNGIHPGDPSLIYNGNATAASTLVLCAGYYGKY